MPIIPPKEDLDNPDGTQRVGFTYIPLMVSADHPLQYPMLKFPEGTSFLNSDEYFIENGERVYLTNFP